MKPEVCLDEYNQSDVKLDILKYIASHNGLLTQGEIVDYCIERYGFKNNKTVRSYLNTLENFGFIYHQRLPGKENYWRIDYQQVIEYLNQTIDEIEKEKRKCIDSVIFFSVKQEISK